MAKQSCRAWRWRADSDLAVREVFERSSFSDGLRALHLECAWTGSREGQRRDEGARQLGEHWQGITRENFAVGDKRCMLMGMRAVLALMVVAGTAAAGSAPGAWVGQVQPVGDPLAPCADCALSCRWQRARHARRAAAQGRRAARRVRPRWSQPLVGIAVAASVGHGRWRCRGSCSTAATATTACWCCRAGTHACVSSRIARGDPNEIRAALLRDETLAGIKKALAKLEIGEVDTDGDGRVDFAVTYGCSRVERRRVPARGASSSWSRPRRGRLGRDRVAREHGGRADACRVAAWVRRSC